MDGNAISIKFWYFHGCWNVDTGDSFDNFKGEKCVLFTPQSAQISAESRRSLVFEHVNLQQIHLSAKNLQVVCNISNASHSGNWLG